MPGPPPTTSWPRRVLTRASLLLVGLVLGALIGEVLLRVVGYDGDHGRRGSLFDSPYGRVLPENWIYRLQIDPEVDREVQIRSQTIPLEKAPEETRVLFVGDSGTAGLYLDIEHSFPMQLAERLDRTEPGHDYRVINGGATGMTNVGELNLLRDKLRHLDPDVVVLGLFLANDINFNLGHQERPEARGTGWLARLSASSALVHFLQLSLLDRSTLRGPWNDSPRVALPLIDRDGVHMLNDSAGEIATYVREPSELTERAFGLLRSVLADFVALGKEHDFSFAVLLIPTRSAVTGRLELTYQPAMLTDLMKHGSPLRREDLDFSLPTQRVLAMCADLGIPCIDPTERMQRIGEDVFLPDDEHTSIRGHGVLAEELLKNRDAWLPSD
ncbi:MAG: hypothetical protein AAGA20_00785 [Planctomycetota bacterium]